MFIVIQFISVLNYEFHKIVRRKLCSQIYTYPDTKDFCVFLIWQDNLFEWHFSVRGPPDSDFAGGRYHGRIILPPEYPMKPPSIMLLTVSMMHQVEDLSKIMKDYTLNSCKDLAGILQDLAGLNISKE